MVFHSASRIQRKHEQDRHVLVTIVTVEKECVTYSEFVFVALVIQHTMRMRLIVICGQFGFTVFFHIIS